MRKLHRTPARRIRCPSSRNPLVVQFWLLGLDAAQGRLRARGFTRVASPHGSSLYTLYGLTLHAKGLWLDLPQGRAHSLWPGQAFYRLTAEGDLFSAGSRPPAGAQHLTRIHGLELALPDLTEHQRRIADQRGPLAQRFPPAVRRLVPAWEARMSGRHRNAWTPPQPQLRQPGCPPFRISGGTT